MLNTHLVDDTAIDHARRLAQGYGAHLRERRKELNVSLRELAEQIGIAHQYLSEIEKGVRIPTRQEDQIIREWLS